MNILPDILTRIETDFKDLDKRNKVTQIIGAIGPTNVGSDQLRRAVLVIANGKLEKVKEVCEHFYCDPRDVLSEAHLLLGKVGEYCTIPFHQMENKGYPIQPTQEELLKKNQNSLAFHFKKIIEQEELQFMPPQDLQIILSNNSVKLIFQYEYDLNGYELLHTETYLNLSGDQILLQDWFRARRHHQKALELLKEFEYDEIKHYFTINKLLNFVFSNLDLDTQEHKTKNPSMEELYQNTTEQIYTRFQKDWSKFGFKPVETMALKSCSPTKI